MHLELHCVHFSQSHQLKVVRIYFSIKDIYKKMTREDYGLGILFWKEPTSLLFLKALTKQKRITVAHSYLTD